MGHRIRWVKYKSYSGVKIAGSVMVPKPTSLLHMERAYWLTAMLEAPQYGSVQSYDGAAMSGGSLHNIAVYPKTMTQGSFFPLLRRLETSGSPEVQPLWDALAEINAYVARDGKLRHLRTGNPISGRAIRNEFTPSQGTVPKRGKLRAQAEKWATLFHKLLSDPLTFAAQKDYAVDYLIKTRAADERKFYGTRDLQLLRTGNDLPKGPHNLPLSLDLALCVYHSHSVNAPAPAKSMLLKTLAQVNPWTAPETFARRLIYNLGKKRYGRWRDTTTGKNRYDRTRHWAKAGKLWPAAFFQSYEEGGLMPADLPGRYSLKS